MLNKIKRVLKNNKYYIIIVFIAMLICSGFTVKGLFSAHDRYSHIARIYSTVRAIKELQFPPLIGYNLARGFGYSWNIFYPPLGALVGAICKIITPTYMGALKLTVFLFVILAGISMYNFIKEVTKNDKTALITSIIYITSNYFLLDIYNRLALGEITAYAFFPILLDGLYRLFYKDGKRSYLITIGAVGIVLSHNISSVFAVIISIGLTLLNFKKLIRKETRKNIWKNVFINLIFIISMVLFFYAPFIQHIRITNYMVTSEGFMASPQMVADHALYPYQLLFGKFQHAASGVLSDGVSKDMPFSLGLTLIIPLICTPLCYKKVKNKKLYLLTLFAGIFTALMSTTLFPWGKLTSLTSMIQFPWRMLLVSTVLLSIIAGINIEKCLKKIEDKHIMVILMIVFVYTGLFISNITAFDVGFDETFLYTDTVEELSLWESKDCSSFEYLPNLARNDYFLNRSSSVEVIDGNAIIEDENKYGSTITFKITKNDQDSIVELPYIYYMGYSAEINGEKYNVEESENGFCCIRIKSGTTGDVKVKYTGTKTQIGATAISLIFSIVFVIFIIFEEREEKTLT